MEQFIELLKEVNIVQIFILLGFGAIFYNRIKVDIKEISNRIDRLSEKVEDIDRRLCRIEGSLASQGHCLFSQSNQNPDKKAQ